MGMGHFYALLGAVIAVLFACVLSFFAPFPRTVLRSERGVYECAWENGGKSQETYSSAFAALSHFDGESTVIERGGVTGYIAADEEACRCGRILHAGKLSDLLTLDFSALDRLHRAALARWDEASAGRRPARARG